MLTVGDIIASNPDLKGIQADISISKSLDMMKEWQYSVIAIYGDAHSYHGLGSLDIGNAGINYHLGGHHILGLISILDILIYLSSRSSNEQLNEALNEPILVVIGKSQDSQNLWMEPFAKPFFQALHQISHCTHHAIAFDRDLSQQPKMFSQWDVIKYLYESSSTLHLDGMLAIPVNEIQTTDVNTIKLYTPITETLVQLRKHHCLAVMDDVGRLLSSISTSDFIGFINTTVASVLPMSVMEYLLYKNANCIPHPIVMKGSQSIKHAMNLILSHHIHQVWIVNEEVDDELYGVVSCTDILSFIYKANVSHQFF